MSLLEVFRKFDGRIRWQEEDMRLINYEGQMVWNFRRGLRSLIGGFVGPLIYHGRPAYWTKWCSTLCEILWSSTLAWIWRHKFWRMASTVLGCSQSCCKLSELNESLLLDESLGLSSYKGDEYAALIWLISRLMSTEHEDDRNARKQICDDTRVHW